MKLYFGTTLKTKAMDWQVHVLDIHEDEVLGSIRGRADLYLYLGDQLRSLDPKLDLLNKSPDGFSWGHGGSGPSQLSFALVYDAFEGHPKREDLARQVMHAFKEELVSRIAQTDSWVMSDVVVRAIVRGLKLRLEGLRRIPA